MIEEDLKHLEYISEELSKIKYHLYMQGVLRMAEMLSRFEPQESPDWTEALERAETIYNELMDSR